MIVIENLLCVCEKLKILLKYLGKKKYKKETHRQTENKQNECFHVCRVCVACLCLLFFCSENSPFLQRTFFEKKKEREKLSRGRQTQTDITQ